MITKIARCILLLTLSITNLGATETIPTYQLLSERRPTMQFPHYSIDQKKLVLDQVRLILGQVFVHHDLKIKDFGPATDPLPFIVEIEKKIETITDYDFHKQIAEIFFKQKDFHTSYSFPRPYACYRSFIPISFKEVKDISGNNVMAVSEISENADIMKLMPAEFRIEVGDIVLSYDGLPIRQAMQNLVSRSRGANPAAVLRHTSSLLTYRGQNSDIAPAKDKVDLILRNRLGRTYSTTIPWIASAKSACLEQVTTPEKLTAKLGPIGANENQIEFKKIFRKHRLAKSLTDSDGLKDTLEPILKYKKLGNEFGNFGYFQLESFSPEKLTVDGVVLEFKKILQTEFLHSAGVIIDLRDNGGGQIKLADKLVQLFTAKNPTPMNFKLKNSPANIFYMESVVPNGSFTKALRVAAQTGAPFTKELYLSNLEDINSLGQYFFRPVMLLTNSSCYSSCDIFSAQMQDHGAAVVFGEDANTGAGGANNYDLNSIISDFKEGESTGPFKKLPSFQNIGFAFRQSVRVGLHKGELIEDVGVIADQLAAPSISDLYNFSENQFKILTKEINRTIDNYQSWVAVANDGKQDIGINEVPTLFTKWSLTNAIDFKINGQSIGMVFTEESNTTGREIEIPQAVMADQYKLGKFEMIGYYNNQKVWRKVISYRVVPKVYSAVSESGMSFDLSQGQPSFLKIYNDQTQATDGGLVSNGVLRIGSGESYEDYTNTSASAFLTMPTNPLKLQFEASIATEKDYDFFKVVVVSEGKETTLIASTSGNIAMKSYVFDLSAFANKKIEVRFAFESDEGGSDKGVIVQNISMSK